MKVGACTVCRTALHILGGELDHPKLPLVPGHEIVGRMRRHSQSDIPAFPSRDFWHERVICSVANLTRRDGAEFFALAAKAPVRTHTEAFPLEAANEALARLRSGAISGAADLLPGLAAARS